MGDDDSTEMRKQLAGAGESVLAIAVLATLGVWGGGWLDQNLHTAPWLQVVLALLGCGLGLTRMVMKALQAEKK
jgi:F0F1-type ATP synthase assembly protein I